MLLKDKVAVITGGGRGIGRVIALACGEEGVNLVLAARSLEAMEETRAAITGLGREALVVPADIRDANSVQAMAAKALEYFGHVDVLVNNSGITGPTARLWEIAPEEWEETFTVNVTGVFLCCRAFLPSIVQRQAGRILIITSMHRKRPLGWRSPFAARNVGLG